jgi:hypothetical protein
MAKPPRDLDDASPFGPINNPVDRFIHLPEGTRRWLEQLRAEDLRDLDDARKFQHQAKAIGKFFKWVVLSIFALFIMAAQFGEAISKLFAMVFRTK